MPVFSADTIEKLTVIWGVSAGFISLGLLYRVSVLAFLVNFGYIFLLEKTEYLNHFYFVILLAICLLVVPANRVWSLDAFFTDKDQSDEGVPNWCYFLLKGQIEIMLIWAGLVKINADWLAGKPLGFWLERSSENAPAF